MGSAGSRGFFFFPHATKFCAKATSSFLSYRRKRPFAWIGRGLAKEARHQACSNATGSSGAIALRKIAAEKNVIGHRGQ